MAQKDLPSSAKKAWNNAKKCHCGADQDNSNAHKQCFRCKKHMEFGAYEGWAKGNPSCWNVEHITPKSAGGTNEANNLRAVHKKCNK